MAQALTIAQTTTLLPGLLEAVARKVEVQAPADSKPLALSFVLFGDVQQPVDVLVEHQGPQVPHDQHDRALHRDFFQKAHRILEIGFASRPPHRCVDRRAPRHAFIHTRYGVGYKLEAEPK